MKGAIFSILLLFSLIPQRSYGQKGLEVMVFRGWYPTVYKADLLPELRSLISSGELIKPDQIGEPVLGKNGMEVHFNFSDRLAVGISVSHFQRNYEVGLVQFRRPYNTLADLTVQERSFILSPSARFNWFPGKSIIYSGVQLGIWHWRRTSDRDDIMDPLEQIMPTAQATLIGLRFGGALAGHVEWGYGHKGIILFGLSYSFTTRNSGEGDPEGTDR